jgi:nitrogenase molybdenum-iron protein alpha chain
MKINLDPVDVSTREQRLGTIIAWDGRASELSEASRYARGNDACCESGCRLCESRGPFTQASSCSEEMTVCQVGHVRGAVLIQHSPIGCAANQGGINQGFRTGLRMRHLPVEDAKSICTNLDENDMIFGGIGKLEQSIQDAWSRYHPTAIFITGACATGIIGDDISSLAEKYTEEYHIPVVPLHCEGFRSKHWSTGFDVAQHGILRQIVNRNSKKQEDLVNVISLWGSDVFTPMFKELDLRVNYAIVLSTVEELAQMSEAAATVTFCYTLSSYIAAALEQEFGVPEVKAPQPYTSGNIRDLIKDRHAKRENL